MDSIRIYDVYVEDTYKKAVEVAFRTPRGGFFLELDEDNRVSTPSDQSIDRYSFTDEEREYMEVALAMIYSIVHAE